MDTSGGTVYFGRYITNENVPLSALCEQIAMYSGLTAIQARAILEGSFDAIAALEGDYPNATLDIGMARYVEGELTPETLTIPIHLNEPSRLIRGAGGGVAKCSAFLVQYAPICDCLRRLSLLRVPSGDGSAF